MSRKKFRYPTNKHTDVETATKAREELKSKWPKGSRVQVNARGRLLNVRKHEGKEVQYTGRIQGYPRNIMIDGHINVVFDGLAIYQLFPIEYLEIIKDDNHQDL